jgi:hypothetical protein
MPYFEGDWLCDGDIRQKRVASEGLDKEVAYNYGRGNGTIGFLRERVQFIDHFLSQLSTVQQRLPLLFYGTFFD